MDKQAAEWVADVEKGRYQMLYIVCVGVHGGSGVYSSPEASVVSLVWLRSHSTD